LAPAFAALSVAVSVSLSVTYFLSRDDAVVTVAVPVASSVASSHRRFLSRDDALCWLLDGCYAGCFVVFLSRDDAAFLVASRLLSS
jgi:hypothetical protein